MFVFFWIIRLCSLLKLVSLVKSSSVTSVSGVFDNSKIMGNKMSSNSNNNSDDDDVVMLTHESGASAKIYLYGATITSFVTASKKEILFVSEKAILDGSKAIRGGIPLVFPIFGPPSNSSESDMPQHGFARNNRWTLITSNKKEEAILELNYKNQVVNGIGTKGFWSSKEEGDHDVTLRLTVRIQAESISTTLDITNTSTNTPLDNLQALFHTYYQIENHAALNPDTCAVLSGLDGYSIIDKVDATASSTPSCHPPNTSITVTGEVDRIYNPPTDKKTLNVIIQTGSNSKIDLTAEASIVGSSSPLPVSVVVWNPHIEKAKRMGDFGDEQYNDMLCVEPGILNDVPPLEPNQTLQFTQTISTS